MKSVKSPPKRGGFSTPKGFGPMVTKLVRRSDVEALYKNAGFQYPEGFWPDGDRHGAAGVAAHGPRRRFSTPRGFGPMVT